MSQPPTYPYDRAMKPNPTRADLARTLRRGKTPTALALATMMVFVSKPDSLMATTLAQHFVVATSALGLSAGCRCGSSLHGL